MRTANINTIHGLIIYVKENSTWQKTTIRNVITALGYNLVDERMESLKELSGNLADCSKHGADGGFPGLSITAKQQPFFSQPQGHHKKP
jgi:hypothetical protein